MIIKKWSEFNESSNEYNNDYELDYVLNWIFNNIDSKDIPSLKRDINSIIQITNINESFLTDIRDKLSKWFDYKIFNYIVNKKSKFYTKLNNKLNFLDLTTLEDVEKYYRSFKLDSIYLAGGMDKASDVGAGWRAMVEYEFEVNNPGKKSKNEEITIPYSEDLGFKGETKISPSYVVDDENLKEFIKRGNSYVRKNFSTPALLNPVRKEVDRTKNDRFASDMGEFKSGRYLDNLTNRSFDEISRTFSKTIELEDELIVNKCDAIFVGFNEAASAGTFGELEMSSFLKKPIFAWYMDGWPIHGHSPWNLPHVCKIMRTNEDMELFVRTMIKYNK